MTAPVGQTESLTTRICWLTLAKCLGFALSTLLPLILVRRLDQEQYGIYKQAFLIATTAMIVLPLGFQMSAYYFLPLQTDRRREIVASILLWNAIIGALGCAVLCIYPSILGAIFQGTELVLYARWIGLVILLWIVGAFAEVLPIANQEIRAASVVIVGLQASRMLIFVVTAVWFSTVPALLIAAILHGVIQIGALFFYVYSRFPGFWRHWNRPMFAAQLSYAFPLGMAGLLLTIQTEFHNYFVARQFSAATFAMYAVGTFQLPFIGILQEASNSVLIARITILQQQGRNSEIILLLARAARKLAAVYFPVFALLLIIGPEVIRLLFTSRYSASWPIFAVNLLWLPLNIVLLDPLYRAFPSDRWFILRLRFALITALLAVLSLWTRQLGLTGVIGAVVAIGALERIAATAHFARRLGVNRQHVLLLNDIGKLAIAAAIAGLAAAMLRWSIQGSTPLPMLAACTAIFTGVYAGAAAVLQIPSPDERRYLREWIARWRPRPLPA